LSVSYQFARFFEFDCISIGIMYKDNEMMLSKCLLIGKTESDGDQHDLKCYEVAIIKNTIVA